MSKQKQHVPYSHITYADDPKDPYGHQPPKVTFSSTKKPKKSKKKDHRWVVSLIIAVVCVGVFFYQDIGSGISHIMSHFHKTAGCNDPKIKGNISFTTGEKIYHVPGDPFYNRTAIDTSQGERMFCTVKEAQAAGWRASGK